MHVLIVDGDASRARMLQEMLGQRGWRAERAGRAEDGLAMVQAYDYDAVLLALVLPDLPGRELIRRLRHADVETAVVALSPTGDTVSIVDALNLGADDCLPAAFAPAELAARLAAAARRSKGFSKPVIEAGRLAVNLNTRAAEADGRPVDLTAKEYAMLELLALRKGAVVTRETILDHLYGGLDEPDTRAVDVHICRLRRKLAAACGEDGHIHTCWGRGFMLRAPEPPARLAA